MARRSVLLAAVASGGAATVGGCAGSPSETTTGGQAPDQTTAATIDESASSSSSSSSSLSDEVSRTILVYFSRPGENYYYGDRIDLETGNTEVLADMISARAGCEVYRIEAADPYSDDYDATVQRNSEEQESDARPEIAGALPDLAAYDTVLLASPIWNVRPPMIMRTFTDALDFAGKTVHPVVTSAVSGIGTAEDDYADACPGATLGPSLAVQGEAVAEAGPDVDTWLAEAGIART